MKNFKSCSQGLKERKSVAIFHAGALYVKNVLDISAQEAIKSAKDDLMMKSNKRRSNGRMAVMEAKTFPRIS